MGLDTKRSSSDWLVCKCGNEPHLDGFFPCLPNGEVVEPVVGGQWDGFTYLCTRCQSIYDIESFETLGVAGV